jgi:multidrug resistance efflux pump
MSAQQLLTRLTANRTLWRLALAILFIVPLLLVVPHFRSLVVRNAVVTAYFKSLRAPIDGDVVEVTVSPGELVKAGQPAMLIVNPRVDRSRVARLQVLRDEAERQVSAQQEAVAELRKMADARQTELGRYVESLFDEMETEKKVLVERAAAFEAAVKEAENSLARARQLFSRKNVSRASLEAAEAKFQDARAARTQNTLELQRLGKQLEDLGQGIFQTEVPDGALQTLFLAQELSVELTRENRELRQMKVHLHATEAELEAAGEALKRQSEATVRVPPGMTIWHTDVTQGSSVAVGTKLLSYVDCSNLLLDIAVDDATLELIRPGDEVRVRLFGRPGYVDGTVRLVRGSASLAESDDLAAVVQDRGLRAGRVLAALDDPALAMDSGRTCGIGRAAYAELKHIGFFEAVLLQLVR